ncbi:MAG: hypothetical protein V7K21_28695 [Nostoc sp.]
MNTDQTRTAPTLVALGSKIQSFGIGRQSLIGSHCGGRVKSSNGGSVPKRFSNLSLARLSKEKQLP